jgi:mannose-6-phosphate isomerase-like protein (cupin superfamily)
MQKLTPFQVPTTDGKKIYEHFGLASANFGDFSLAHMIAPPGWTEPNQTPDFNEFVVVVRGEITLFLNDAPVVVGAGESIVAPKGIKVRYANTSDVDAEYMALCMPALRPDRVHREELGVGV